MYLVQKVEDGQDVVEVTSGADLGTVISNLQALKDKEDEPKNETAPSPVAGDACELESGEAGTMQDDPANPGTLVCTAATGV